MKSAVCTLFEGSYHFGVAALANSLCRSGFAGTMYAGYRGPLPPWASAAERRPMSSFPAARALRVRGGAEIVFLPLAVPHHLTNFKPEFMLELLDGPARDVDAIAYVDPDICVTAPWRFFEQWLSCGVALCEDVNSPLSEHHPRRIGWRRYYEARGLALRFRMAEYVNGGFVGVRATDRAFLHLWKQAIHGMVGEIGSLATASLSAGQTYRSTGFADCFDRTDQDALNVAIEAGDTVVSIVGQEAMAFKPGAALLPHALGAGKPWQRSYLGSALRGVSPRLADKAFWDNASGPIAAHGATGLTWKRMEIAAGSAIGRFMRRA